MLRLCLRISSLKVDISAPILLALNQPSLILPRTRIRVQEPPTLTPETPEQRHETWSQGGATQCVDQDQSRWILISDWLTQIILTSDWLTGVSAVSPDHLILGAAGGYLPSRQEGETGECQWMRHDSYFRWTMFKHLWSQQKKYSEPWKTHQTHLGELCRHERGTLMIMIL